MSYNKSKSALPEKSRFIFFEIGMIIVLTASLAAFNYKWPYGYTRTLPDPRPYDVVEEFPVITQQKKENLKPPPVSPTVINIVDDFVPVDSDFNIDVEDDFYTPAEKYVPEVPEEAPVPEEVFEFVDVAPEFPGGPNALQEWLGAHIAYPRAAIEAGIEGTVYLSFIVSKNGSVRDVKVMRGENYVLNEEALRVGLMMPDWKPGILDGTPVNAKYVIPVKFRLQ